MYLYNMSDSISVPLHPSTDLLVLTLQEAHLIPVAESGTRRKSRSVSRSFGDDVPRNAIMISFAVSSRNSVAWVSVVLSLKYCTTEEPEGGFVQVSPYAAEEKAVYLTMLLKIVEVTAQISNLSFKQYFHPEI